MIRLLPTGSEKGHVCYPALLNINCANLTGRVLVKLWLAHWQRLTGFLSGWLTGYLKFRLVLAQRLWGSKLNDWWTCWHVDWLATWVASWLDSWLACWLTKGLAGCLIDLLLEWLSLWLTAQMPVCVACWPDWIGGCLTDFKTALVCLLIVLPACRAKFTSKTIKCQ